MGLSASQARLLHLTNRMHQLEYNAARIQAQKLKLANDSDEAYDNYLNELDKKKIQYRVLSEDGTSTFVDATLSALLNSAMEPKIFLRNAETGAIYITQDYANRMGIDVDNSQPYNGTLEDYLIENNAPTKIKLDSSKTYMSDTPVTPVDTTYEKITCTTVDDSQLLENGKTYSISNAAELKRFSTIVANGGNTSGITVILANDIDMSSITDFSSISNFQGTFNGNGHKISNLNTSLFDSLNGATVSNLELVNSQINSTTSRTGTLANQVVNSNINNIKASGSVNSTTSIVGGLIGDVDNSTITNCVFSGSVKGSNAVGGLIGRTNSTNINNCSVSGSVDANCQSGGFVGTATGGNITNSSSDCTITVNANAITTNPDSGGFIGHAGDNIIIDNCSAKGTLIDSTTNKSSVCSGFLGCTNNTGSVTIKNSDSYVNVQTNNVLTCGFASAYSGGTLNLEHCNSYGTITTSTPSNAYGFTYTADPNGSMISQTNVTDCYTSSSSTFTNSNTNVTSSSTTTPYTNNINVSAPNLSTSAVSSAAIPISDLKNYEVHEEKYVDSIDYTNPVTQNLINQYNLRNTGFIIQDQNYNNGYEDSSEWLTNMILSGTAILSRFETDSEGNSSYIDTSVAVEPSLQEAADESQLKKAEAQYEADIKEINKKDRRYDTELAKFETERNATKQEMETLKTVAKDNIDLTFKLFS